MIRATRGAIRAWQRFLPATPEVGGILCYHLVGAGTSLPVDLSLPAFRAQLDTLQNLAEIVPLSTMIDPASRPSSRTRRRVAITFDDAYANFAEVAWPELESRRLPATLFVPTEFVNGRARGPLTGAESLLPVGWEWLRETVATGLLSVGSHSRTHQDLRTLGAVHLEEELRDSRGELEDRLSVDVTAFCYPRALRNTRVESAVRRHYSLAVMGGGRGIDVRTTDRFRLSRTSVRADVPFPVRRWVDSRIWIEEALADRVRQLR